MKTLNPLFLVALTLIDTVAGMAAAQTAAATGAGAESRVQMLIEGGHETDPRDHGRPVALIAAALGVTPEVFRDAFSRVKPAPAGEAPDPEQVQLNKQTLLRSLGPHGVNNERLDEISNYYRYSDRDGGLWRHTPATVYATVNKGKVTEFMIINPGSGYTVAPVISIPGMPQVKISVTLAFGADPVSNGSLKEIKVASVPSNAGQ